MSNILEGLNDRQREAALTEHPRTLVLAGAGAGKTATIIKKIQYLIFEKGVKSSRILAITFTKDAANEMIDRLITLTDSERNYQVTLEDKRLSKEQKDIKRREYKEKVAWLKALTIRTFHSYSYMILNRYSATVSDNRFKLILDKVYDTDKDAISSRSTNESSNDILRKSLISLVQDEEYLLKLKRFILDYYVDEPRNRKFNKRKDYPNPITALDGTQVKSKSERDIANWLYAHRIQYVYEPKVNFKDFTFHPDFYLNTLDIYIEHTGGNGTPIKDKEDQFRIAGKNCYTLYEDQNYDLQAYHEALERIVAGKVDIEAHHPPLKFEDEFRAYQDKVKDFLAHVNEAMDKMKVEDIDFQFIYDKAKLESRRISQFYALAEPIITKYQEYCNHYAYFDFNDLVLKSQEILEQQEEVRESIRNTYDYILVDEFQDVNTLQVQFLKAIVRPETKLFCVGDDWQSIYGFRGSEVRYIVNFEQYFPNAITIKFDLNYRSTPTIVNASNHLIRYNKNQLHKDIQAFKEDDNRKIVLYTAQNEHEDGVQFVLEKIQKLHDDGFSKDEILILYRRTRDVIPFADKAKELSMKFSRKTIHGSKGLEAKVVFIVGLRDDNFPQVWQADRLFQLIKEENIDFLLEEERRLFYVALTRAKETVYLISELGIESQFIEEIGSEFVQRIHFQVL